MKPANFGAISSITISHGIPARSSNGRVALTVWGARLKAGTPSAYSPISFRRRRQRQFQVMSEREQWFRVVMGQDAVAKLITPESERTIPLPSSAAEALSFNLSLDLTSSSEVRIFTKDRAECLNGCQTPLASDALANGDGRRTRRFPPPNPTKRSSPESPQSCASGIGDSKDRKKLDFSFPRGMIGPIIFVL